MGSNKTSNRSPRPARAILLPSFDKEVCANKPIEDDDGWAEVEGVEAAKEP